MKRIVPALSTIFIIVGIIAIGWMLYEDEQETQRRQAAGDELARLTSPLLMEERKLEQQINDCQQQIKRLNIGTATAEYVVSDMSVACYNEVLTTLNSFGQSASFAVSLGNFPDEDGCISLSQARELGWGYLYQFNTREVNACGLIRWLTLVKSKAAEKGIELQGAILFPDGAFQEEYVPALRAAGISIILHHGEAGHDLFRMEEKDGMIYAGTHWWWLNSINSSKLGTAHSLGGNMVIDVGRMSSYSESNSPHSHFSSFANHTEIRFTDFAGMIAQQEENQHPNAEAIHALDQEIEAARARMAEIQQEIKALNEQYRP